MGGNQKQRQQQNRYAPLADGAHGEHKDERTAWADGGDSSSSKEVATPTQNPTMIDLWPHPWPHHSVMKRDNDGIDARRAQERPIICCGYSPKDHEPNTRERIPIPQQTQEEGTSALPVTEDEG